MRKPTLATLALALGLSIASLAAADDPAAQSFVEKQHDQITGLLRQPASAGRDAQINHTLDTMVDYDELTHRAFGSPCPAAEPGCENHWAELKPEQQAEVTAKLKQLVQKNYKKNLIKTLDYDITYKGSKDSGADTRIRTEAKSKLKPRDPAVQVDYVVRPANGAYHIVDIVTEGSFLTKNYYDQFHKMLTDPTKLYPHLVQKLDEKIAKPD
jgi:phospholipid transport system substrate-binding protein